MSRRKMPNKTKQWRRKKAGRASANERTIGDQWRNGYIYPLLETLLSKAR